MGIYLYKAALGTLVLLGLWSCDRLLIFPDNSPIDPTIVNTITVNLDVKADNITGMGTATPHYADSSKQLRVIIEAYEAGKLNEVVMRKEVSTSQLDPYNLHFTDTILLGSRKYTLLLWMDYVERGAERDLYYTTLPSLRAIKVVDPTLAGTDMLDCFCATTDIDLSAYKDAWYVHLPWHVSLERPVAKYMLVATDVQEFVAQQHINPSDLEQYTAVVSYSKEVPTRFDAFQSKPTYSQGGVSYTSAIQLLNENEALLAFDYQFLEGNTTDIPLSIQIRKGNIILKQSSITVPITKGQLNVMRQGLLLR